MKRRELLAGAGKLAAAAVVAPAVLVSEPAAPFVTHRFTTQYLATFEGQVRELLLWDRGLSPAETAELSAYLEKKYATT